MEAKSWAITTGSSESTGDLDQSSIVWWGGESQLLHLNNGNNMPAYLRVPQYLPQKITGKPWSITKYEPSVFIYDPINPELVETMGDYDVEHN